MNRSTRFTDGIDGRSFRSTVFAALADQYRGLVLGAMEILQNVQLEFSSIAKSHAEQLRPDLLFRHSLPFCVTESSFFELTDRSERFLAALLAGHTLALTHLDYHLDGSSPDPFASATAFRMDPATAVAYSVRMIYCAGRILDGEEGGSIFRDALDPVSGFVVSRMYQDWLDRYSWVALTGSSAALRDYLGSPQSRILGSGYWEVMVRGSFASHGAIVPPPVAAAVKRLRKLRQLVDEIADFDDDISAGLVTAPLLLALNETGGASETLKLVDRIWRAGKRRERDHEALSQLWCIVDGSGGFKKTASLADELWLSSTKLCKRRLGERAPGFLTLLDLKRAKLADLERSGWRSGSSTEQFFP